MKEAIKIGIVSENPHNDGTPIADLLERYFPEKASYTQLLPRFRGSQLGNDDFIRALETIFEEDDLAFIILIKDLDRDANRKKCNEVFEKCKCATNEKIEFLLFEYMIEALAIADIATTCFKYKKKPHEIRITANTKNAKKALIDTFGYEESDMRDLVQLFDIEKLKTYPIWQTFIKKMTEKVNISPVF